MNRVFEKRFGTNLPQLLKNKKLLYKVDMTFLKKQTQDKILSLLLVCQYGIKLRSLSKSR